MVRLNALHHQPRRADTEQGLAGVKVARVNRLKVQQVLLVLHWQRVARQDPQHLQGGESTYTIAESSEWVRHSGISWM